MNLEAIRCEVPAADYLAAKRSPLWVVIVSLDRTAPAPYVFLQCVGQRGAQDTETALRKAMANGAAVSVAPREIYGDARSITFLASALRGVRIVPVADLFRPAAPKGTAARVST